MVEDSLNRNIIFDKRNAYGSFQFDEQLGLLNQNAKDMLLLEIKERERKIFGHYERRTQTSRIATTKYNISHSKLSKL